GLSFSFAPYRCNMLYLFIFQAEDDIRDATVTGVQTCALPIFRAGRDPHACLVCHSHTLAVTFGDRARALDDDGIERIRVVEKRRSEERRVGKGCGCQWWACH